MASPKVVLARVARIQDLPTETGVIAEIATIGVNAVAVPLAVVLVADDNSTLLNIFDALSLQNVRASFAMSWSELPWCHSRLIEM